MRPAHGLQRGTIFRAVHDETYELWRRDEPREKFGVVFNVTPPSERDDVLYFITTKNTSRYTRRPYLLSECLILPKGSYACFDHKTAIEFDELWEVPLVKLRRKGLMIVGQLSPEHVATCEAKIRLARILLPEYKKLIGLV
jgi:hypothetical protein